MGFDVTTLLGAPFKYGGRDASGIDCYGVVMEYYRQMGIEIEDPLEYVGEPEGMRDTDLFEKHRKGHWEEVVGVPQVGDVVTFTIQSNVDAATHCGVLDRDGKVIHATKGRGVVRTPLRFLRNRLRRIYRRCQE